MIGINGHLNIFSQNNQIIEKEVKIIEKYENDSLTIFPVIETQALLIGNQSSQGVYLKGYENTDINDKHGGRENIEDAAIYALNEDTIGEVSLEEMEHEMIKRCLEKFNGNEFYALRSHFGLISVLAKK